VPVINRLINSIWNKEELPDRWKESIIAPIHKTGNKTYYNNYCEITADNVIQNFIKYPFLRLSPKIHEITVDFDVTDKQTSDEIFCIHQILEKKVGVK
jgi:hypothetical protein